MEHQEQGKELVILHFNDAYDIQTDRKGELGFLSFYHYVQKLREIYPSSLLIFSGDAFAPSKLSRVLRGQQMAHCLRLLNIDIACYGNHDFDFQPEHALKLAKSCGFPWLLGNIKYLDTGQNIGQGLDYYVLDKNGIKIGFLGLAGPDFNGRLISCYHKKLKYFDMCEYAKKICKILKELGCQLIIALTHARKPADNDLAKKVSQIDIILGGHDHFSLFQIVNQIPIVKSSSNFQCISIVKIFQKEYVKAQNSKDIRLGRRWLFSSQCKKVKKSEKQSQQIQSFINNAVKQYHQYEKNRNERLNKPKKQVPKLPENKWLLSYGLIFSKPDVSLLGGSSAQVCFAKYVAFKRKCIYSRYKRTLPTLKQNFIEQTLAYVYQQIKSHHNGRAALYSPGINSAPYLIQTANMIYLPSHFVVGISSYEDLVKMLDYSYKKGYQCYAVLEINPLCDKLCAWIKFIEPPKQYLSLLNELKVEDLLIMSCHEKQQKSIKLISQEEQNRNTPKSRDIYILLSKNQKQLNYEISSLIKNLQYKDQPFWRQISQQINSNYIGNLQYSIDCVEGIQPFLRKQISLQKINCSYILSKNVWSLNLIAYHIAKLFINRNVDQQKHPIKVRGIVMNQQLLSNPTYELNYGYIPILYSQQWKNNQERILNALSQEERQIKRWFNMYRKTRINLIKHDSVKITIEDQGTQLAKWIAKYAPKQYDLNYLQVKQIIQCLTEKHLVFKMSQQGAIFPL